MSLKSPAPVPPSIQDPPHPTFGQKGWYWETSPGRFGVVVTCHNLLNKHFNRHLDWQYPPGSEDVLYMSAAEFQERRMLKLLRVDLRRQFELECLHQEKGVDLTRFAPVANDGVISYRYIRPDGSSNSAQPLTPSAGRNSAKSNIRGLVTKRGKS